MLSGEVCAPSPLSAPPIHPLCLFTLGDETTRCGWEYAVIVAIDHDKPLPYNVVWDFNGEKVG